MPPANPPSKKPTTVGELIALVDAGDEDATAQYDKLLENPEFLAKAGRNPPELASLALASITTTQKRHVRRIMKARYQQLAIELTEGHPSPIVRLLAERAALCWLHVHVWEYRIGITIRSEKLGDYHQFLDRASKRYLAALKALHEVRRLPLPSIQVNVAERQVNIAAGALAAATEKVLELAERSGAGVNVVEASQES